MSYSILQDASRYEYEISPQHPLEPEAPGPPDLPAAGIKSSRLEALTRGHRGSRWLATHP